MISNLVRPRHEQSVRRFEDVLSARVTGGAQRLVACEIDAQRLIGADERPMLQMRHDRFNIRQRLGKIAASQRHTRQTRQRFGRHGCLG